LEKEVLARAHAITRGVLTNIGTDQLGNSTPCESWAVRDVINHVVVANFRFARAMRAGDAPPDHEPDYASGDFLSAYDESSALCAAAFDAPGALDKRVSMPFGDLSGSLALWLATTEVFVHGWDLSKATHQSTDLDPTIAVELLKGAEVVSDDLRGPEGVAGFGPRRSPPDSASSADELAAYLGRRV